MDPEVEKLLIDLNVSNYVFAHYRDLFYAFYTSWQNPYDKNLVIEHITLHESSSVETEIIGYCTQHMVVRGMLLYAGEKFLVRRIPKYAPQARIDYHKYEFIKS